MPRFHNINGVRVQFSDAEEAARDAEEATEAARVADYVTNHKYKDDRRHTYPTIGDQLDALWKGGDAQAAMKVIVNKVKSDNPKPGE